MSSIIDDTLSDIAVVFTGRLQSGLTRKEAKSMVLSHGGIVEERLSEFTDYLIAADPHSSSAKMRRAQQLAKKREQDGGLPLSIITEDELWNIAQGGDIALP